MSQRVVVIYKRVGVLIKSLPPCTYRCAAAEMPTCVPSQFARFRKEGRIPLKNKPKMVNAPEGLNQVRFLAKNVALNFMPTIYTGCAFSYIAIWMRKPCDK